MEPEIDQMLLPLRWIALLDDHGERVSDWVRVHPDGSSDGPIVVTRPARVTSFGLAATPDGPTTTVAAPYQDEWYDLDVGDSLQTPPLELS